MKPSLSEDVVKITALPIHIEQIPEELRRLETNGKWGGISPLPPCYSSGGSPLCQLWGILEAPSGHFSADVAALKCLEEILRAVSEDSPTNWNKDRASRELAAHIEEWYSRWNGVY